MQDCSCFCIPWCFLAIGYAIIWSQSVESNARSPGSAVGVNYGRMADNLPSPPEVVALLQSKNVGDVRIFDANAEVLDAFAGSGIRLIVGVPNELLYDMATSRDAAHHWVTTNILYERHNNVQITFLSVGNEISHIPEYRISLLPAMQNLYDCLKTLNLDGSIKISTTHSAAVLAESSFPPSKGRFESSMEADMACILQFLSETNSSFMANVYPFFAYRDAPDQIDLGYALLADGAKGIEDAENGLHYANLFDAQVDTFVAAMAVVGFPDVPIIVTETGWPSSGDAAATVSNAQMFSSNVVRHVGGGTPRRPGPLRTFLFAFFNEDAKPGPAYERHFGLFYPNQSQVYDIDLCVN